MAEINSKHWSWLNGTCNKHPGQTLPCTTCITTLDDDLVRPEVVEAIVKAIEMNRDEDYTHPEMVTPAEAVAVAAHYEQEMVTPTHRPSFRFPRSQTSGELKAEPQFSTKGAVSGRMSSGQPNPAPDEIAKAAARGNPCVEMRMEAKSASFVPPDTYKTITNPCVEMETGGDFIAWNALPGETRQQTKNRLFGDAYSMSVPSMPTIWIALQDLVINSRYSVKARDTKFELALAESIHRDGLLSPISVIQDGEKYLLIGGFRRVAAVKLLGWTTIPARVFSEEPIERIDLVSQETEAEEIGKYIVEAQQKLLDMTNADIAEIYGYLRSVYVKTRKPTQAEIFAHQSEISREIMRTGLQPILDWKIKPMRRDQVDRLAADQLNEDDDSAIAGLAAALQSSGSSFAQFTNPKLGEAYPIDGGTQLDGPADAAAHLHIRLHDGTILGGCQVSSPTLAIHVTNWSPTPPATFAWCPICLDALARAGR